MSKVILKLICPICGNAVWEPTEMSEFRCVKCGEEFPCECMSAVSEDVK
jgi:tRNA(Ile2) C34 agmatinyltransferase TiaS